MTQSVSGLKVIALCSAIAEMHSEMVAARVLSALWREFQFPEEAEPSYHQMKALIKVCGRALSASPFARIASQMMNGVSMPDDLVVCSRLRDVAEALHAIFDVSKGTKLRVTIEGGSSCLFIAAVAYWILDIRTQVEYENGDVLFNSSIVDSENQSTSANVHIRLRRPESTSLSQITVTDSTYILCKPYDIIEHMHDDTQLLSIRQRVLWDYCLSSAFGNVVTKLLKQQDVLGGIFGSIARIRQGFALGEADVHGEDREPFINFTQSAFGKGLAQSVGSVFPELDLPLLKDSMDRALKKSFPEAAAELQSSLETLQASCSCSVCAGGAYIQPREEMMLPPHPACFGCHLVLTCALVDLVSIISTLHNPHGICPTVGGLQWFYIRNTFLAFETDDITCQRESSNRKRVKRLRWFHGLAMAKHSGGLSKILTATLGLFTGHGFDTRPASRTTPIAIAKDGLVIYIEGLVALSTNAESLRSVNLVPGHIARPGDSKFQIPRFYDSVSDPISPPRPKLRTARLTRKEQADPESNDAEGTERDSYGGLALELQHAGGLGSEPWPNHICLTGEMVTPEVTESNSSGDIMLYFRVQGPSVDIVIPPGKFSMEVLLHTGLVGCSRGQCRPFLDERVNHLEVNEGWDVDKQMIKGNGRKLGICCTWDSALQSTVDRVVAFAAVCYKSNWDPYWETNYKVIIRRGECLSCCLRANAQTSGGVRGRILHIM